MNAKELSDVYIKWYKKQISFENIKDNIVQIDLPFTDSFNDEIAIYAIEESDGRIRLTDDGWTINGLEEHGISINRSKNRKIILNKQVKNYGIDVVDDELTITVESDKFPEAKHRLLQAILFVNDMFMLASPNISKLFIDDMKLFFETNNIRATQGVSFMGNSGLTHKFDFLISGFKEIPTRLIKTLSLSNNDTVIAKAILTDITQTRMIRDNPTNYYVFINDLDKNKQKINVNPDIISLFSQNGIKPVKYTERNTVVKELSA
ncbi:DUF1828 domain-containing protein [Lactobacillus sp. 3B(2020)]|uniref:DUF1828 domain-containing protein n=1 Tax=Lactobacillus sp. 3B(2020) TaxID=2695882 RepID=UPI0015DFD02F|nr:DUF1828 domain-containing protein [Lactobacillus sp. 3B(2020)]QLL70261.1 DUF1828 domain-containing protein [Lactobacillus sp. 3B(2020)]